MQAYLADFDGADSELDDRACDDSPHPGGVKRVLLVATGVWCSDRVHWGAHWTLFAYVHSVVQPSF